MRRLLVITRPLAAVLFFVALAYPASVVRLHAIREGYRLAEFVGVMSPSGALGGQIMGFNYQREPAWVHEALWYASTLLVFGPLIALLLAIVAPGGLRARTTLCGRCGGVLRDLPAPQCPHCGGGFA